MSLLRSVLITFYLVYLGPIWCSFRVTLSSVFLSKLPKTPDCLRSLRSRDILITIKHQLDRITELYNQNARNDGVIFWELLLPGYHNTVKHWGLICWKLEKIEWDFFMIGKRFILARIDIALGDQIWAQIGSDWGKMGHIRGFFQIRFSTIWLVEPICNESDLKK